MFQNDNNYQTNDLSSSSASSQITNSANSNVHVIRLTKSKTYAAFLLFIIFTTWFQLIAQVQTGISLVLLAIIGFFLGKLTDQDESHSNHHDSGCRHHHCGCENQFVAQEKDGRTSPAGGQLRLDERKACRRLKLNKVDGFTNRSPTTSTSASETNTLDPLIKKANSALELLKSLSSADSDNTTLFIDEMEEPHYSQPQANKYHADDNHEIAEAN